MDDVFVGSLMSAPVFTLSADATLRSAGQAMLDRSIGSVVVVDAENRIEGILTATDFVQVVAEGHTDPDAAVATAMSTDLVTVGAGETLRSVADLLIEHRVHHVPVVEDDQTVIGVVTTTDVTAYVSGAEHP